MNLLLFLALYFHHWQIRDNFFCLFKIDFFFNFHQLLWKILRFSLHFWWYMMMKSNNIFFFLKSQIFLCPWIRWLRRFYFFWLWITVFSLFFRLWGLWGFFFCVFFWGAHIIYVYKKGSIICCCSVHRNLKREICHRINLSSKPLFNITRRIAIKNSSYIKNIQRTPTWTKNHRNTRRKNK